EFYLPEELAGAGVDGFEPAVEGAVENDVARRCERAAPDRKVFADAPDLFSQDGIPRVELAAMSAGAGEHLHVRADVRRPFDVVDLRAFFLHAAVLLRDVQPSCARRERRRLPVLRARRSRTDVAGEFVRARRFRGIVDEASRLQIDALRAGDVR